MTRIDAFFLHPPLMIDDLVASISLYVLTLLFLLL